MAHQTSQLRHGLADHYSPMQTCAVLPDCTATNRVERFLEKNSHSPLCLFLSFWDVLNAKLSKRTLMRSVGFSGAPTWLCSICVSFKRHWDSKSCKQESCRISQVLIVWKCVELFCSDAILIYLLQFKKRSWAVAISAGWTGWVSNWSIAAFLENRASCHVFFAALRTKWWSFLLWSSTQSSIVNWGVIGIRSLFSVKIYVKPDLNRDTVHSLFCADSFPISTMRLNIDLFWGFLKWLIFTTSPVLRSHSPSSGKMKVS